MPNFSIHWGSAPWTEQWTGIICNQTKPTHLQLILIFLYAVKELRQCFKEKSMGLWITNCIGGVELTTPSVETKLLLHIQLCPKKILTHCIDISTKLKKCYKRCFKEMLWKIYFVELYSKQNFDWFKCYWSPCESAILQCNELNQGRPPIFIQIARQINLRTKKSEFIYQHTNYTRRECNTF